MNSNTSRAKRQRMSPTAATTVNHLSADLWCDIADFLPKTSRALLAVALTAPPASFRESGWKGQPNTLSRAIISSAKDSALTDSLLLQLELEEGWTQHSFKGRIGDDNRWTADDLSFSLAQQIKQYYDSKWEMMDFVDIPKSLALRLNDDDVGAVLVCIDAANNLKRLKLTHCFNVVGTCLEPLRRSKVLECIDLELVRQFETPWRHLVSSFDKTEFEDEIMLREGTVYEVLGDILCEDGNSLKRLQYPYKWYYNESADSNFPDSEIFHEARYQTMSGRFYQFVNDHNVVVNKSACCLYFNTNAQSVCTGLKENSPFDYANMCIICRNTSFSCCADCNEILCTRCSRTLECSVCNVRYCRSCSREQGFEKKVAKCSGYCQILCFLCRLDICKNIPNTCVECKKLTFDTLLEECNSRQAQIDALRLEIESMRRSSNSTDADG